MTALPHCQTCECIHTCGYAIGSAGCDASDHTDLWFDYCPTCQGRYSDPAHPQERGCDEVGSAPGLLATYRAATGVVDREEAYEALHDRLCACGTSASAMTCPLAVGLVGERCCRGCPDCGGRQP